MKTKRNLSGKSPDELARILLSDLIQSGLTPQTMFDQSICLRYVLPLPHCMPDYENPSEQLEELIDMGDLDDLFPESISSAQDLEGKVGFIVVGEVRCSDFEKTKFDAEGQFDSFDGGIGSWVVQTFAETLEGAYKGIIDQVIVRTRKEIAKGLGIEET